MNKISIGALLIALCASGAASANTFFTGQNQSSQRWYQSTGPSPMSANAQRNQFQQPNQFQHMNRPQQQPGAVRQSTMQQPRPGQPQQQQQQQRPGPQQQADGMGLTLTGGLTHKYAFWGFDMAKAGSVLHYDNVMWNVFDFGAAYGFTAGDMNLRVSAGLQFGAQFGESTMVDDDITNGGIGYHLIDGDENVGFAVSRAISLGKSSGGNMLGYNLGISLIDKFQLGALRINPEIGWRSLSYNLKTNNNHGMSIMVVEDGEKWGTCFRIITTGEIQCLPLVWFNEDTGDIETGDTYFFSQPGTSHDYKVDWSGPYIAIGMEYVINHNNSVNARLEIGLPGYNAVGNQAYRPDWAHPKSVEDNAGVGSARHIGLSANWLTQITDAVQLSIGFSFDNYSVSGATAQTFLNSAWFMNMYNHALDIVGNPLAEEDARIQAQAVVDDILALQQFCPGWVCTDDNEVSSVYRSMGIRVGLSAAF